MRKVCFVLGGFTSGGIGRVVSILANRISQEKGYEVYVVTLTPAKKNEVYLINSNVKRSYLVNECSSMKESFIKATRQLRKYIKNNDIDITIACGNIFYLPVLVSSIGCCKTICWEHSNVYNTKDNFGQTIWRYIASKFSDRIITLTESDRDGFIKRFNAKRVRRIYNPVDDKLFTIKGNYELNSKKIISVGRLCYQKQFELIPKIAEKFIYKHPECEWHIYGSGEDEKNLRGIINEYKLNERVLLKGQVSNLYEIYNDYSLIVMTSRYEGFPMSLLEGAARSLPMISFDVLTGPNEIIVDGENGYLIDKFDINEMALKIDRVLSDDELRSNMSNNSNNKAKEFTVEKIIQEWFEVFNELS